VRRGQKPGEESSADLRTGSPPRTSAGVELVGVELVVAIEPTVASGADLLAVELVVAIGADLLAVELVVAIGAGLVAVELASSALTRKGSG
jgi:hypothetical protein